MNKKLLYLSRLLLTIFLLSPVPLLHAQPTRWFDSSWSDLVKTVLLSRDGIEMEEPVLTLDNEAERLLLTFDLLEEQPRDLRYRFIHCDREWHADELESYEYFSGMDEQHIDDYRNSFTTLQPYVHYHALFPSEFERFTLSGNYVVVVYPYDHPDSILLSRRFFVSENLVEMTLAVERATAVGSLHRDQEITLTIDGPRHTAPEAQALLRPEYLHPWVQQNGRIDNMRELKFSGYASGKLCYRWTDANCFAGGNTFRYFDISNLRSIVYNVQQVERYGGETHVILRPEEDRSRKPYTSNESLNGGMKINIWDRNDATVEADYAWVYFSLPVERPQLGGSIHLVGELTQWHLDDASRLDWDPERKRYAGRLYLKQGY